MQHCILQQPPVTDAAQLKKNENEIPRQEHGITKKTRTIWPASICRTALKHGRTHYQREWPEQSIKQSDVAHKRENQREWPPHKTAESNANTVSGEEKELGRRTQGECRENVWRMRGECGENDRRMQESVNSTIGPEQFQNRTKIKTTCTQLQQIYNTCRKQKHNELNEINENQ